MGEIILFGFSSIITGFIVYSLIMDWNDATAYRGIEKAMNGAIKFVDNYEAKKEVLEAHYGELS